nr:AraC family transcriptional regulator [Planctomycetota bacterium]
PHPLLDALPGRIRSWTNARCGVVIERICDEAARAQPFADLATAGMLLEMLAEILRGQRSVPADGGHMPGLEAAADYLTRSCGDNASVDEAAQITGLSPSRFRTCFAAMYGCSPRDWLLQARLRRAKHLMLGSDLRLTVIAERCGFANVHNLSRAFRRAEGISPSEFRRYGPARHLVEGRKPSYPH